MARSGKLRIGCACAALRRASRALTRYYEEVMAATGLTIPQYALLCELERLGRAPLSRLAEALVLDRTSLYRALSPLARRRLLTVRPSPGDRRAKVARLTAAGRARLAAARPPWQRAQEAFLAAYGADDWTATATGLRRALEVTRDLERGGATAESGHRA